jgi:hypothetical protein
MSDLPQNGRSTEPDGAAGSVIVEYVVVLTLLSLGAALAVVACGVPLFELYRAEVRWLGLPFP